MDLYFDIAGGQIDGAREYQEDAFLTTFVDDDGGPKSAALVIMADGMGGHAAGNIAANLVVSTFNQTFARNFGKQETSSLLRDALIKANNGLAESIRETPALDGMGCTMVGGALNHGKLWWVSVGDSHLYRIRDRELTKLNQDHSYGGYLDRMAQQGMDVEPEPGLSRNMLMSAMTGEDIAEIDCPSVPEPLKAGDRLVFASDGLDTLGTGTIIQLSAWSSTPQECVDALLKAVEDAAKPRQDNTTVVVIDALGREVESASPPPVVAEIPTPKEPDPEATQPLSVAEIEAALKREPKPVDSVEREADYERPDAPLPLPAERRSAAPLVVLVLLAVLAAGGYYLYDRGWLESLTRWGSGLGIGSGAPVPSPPPAAPPRPEAPPVRPQAPVAPVAEPAPPAAPASPAPGAEFRDRLASGGEGPRMVEIPGGRFKMGSPGSSVNVDERPRRTVTVAPFALGKYEVTVGEYRRFARATGRGFPRELAGAGDAQPVTHVSWDDAQAYTEWLSRETGQRYRLPSEAEWEYAARAGSGATYPWGYEFKPGVAHCFDCDTGLDPRRPTEVGRFPPNALGLHDTIGNVLEWVRDCHHPSYDGAPGDGGVWEGGDCSVRVARGGAFDTPSSSLRPAKRSTFRASGGFDNVGFRVARDR